MLGPGVVVVSEPDRAGLLAAELVANRVRARPGVRLLLPTGHTPREMYAALRMLAADGALPLAHAAAFQLDEYLGLGPADPRSFRATLDRELAGLTFGTRHGLDGSAPDPDAEAARYQALLDEQPIDLAVLGIGRDAHVAFNEPGTSVTTGVHRVALEASTLAANAADFGGAEHVPTEALTTGLRTLRAARELLLLATGEAKAEAVHAMLEAPVSDKAPASLLRDHPALTVICDRDAARLLTAQPGWASDRAVVVLGHREPGISAEHRISAHSRARMFRAEEVCLEDPVRAAVLTGWTETGGLSEAEQMQREWTVPGVAALMEVAGRNTAENAARSLPLLLALGAIRRVVVVTSPWHVRARYFFAPYRRYGLRVEMRPSRPLRHWRHLLANEFAQMPAMRRERAEAFGAVRLGSDDRPGPSERQDPG